MQKALRLIFIVATSLFIWQSAQAQIHFTAKLDGAQENPPVTTTATGTGTFTLNSTGTELAYQVTFANLGSALRFGHFHNAATGSNGPIVRDLTFNGTTASGVWKASEATQALTPTLVKELLSGNLYVNVHSNNFGGGEIRGQVRVDYGIGFSANLNGAQENPPVTTTAVGTGSFTLKSSSGGTVTELEYHITVAGLSGSIAAAHFHNAATGTNGGVVRDISFNGNTAEGSWKSSDANQPLSSTLLRELLAGRLYVNVHTAANGGGEIRGQVLVTTGIGFSANLEGAQENPPVTTNARGTGTFMLNNAGTELTYDVTGTGFGSRVTLGHFHNAAVGVNGSVVRDFNFLATATNGLAATAIGVWKSSDATQPLTPTLLNELLSGNIYANLHTSQNGGGEIRGQLKLNLGISFSTKLTGLQEAPTPVITRSTGTGFFVLADGGNELTYQVTYASLSSSFSASHFHNAAAGVAGGVVRNVNFSSSNPNTAAGSWKNSDATQPLSPALLVELLGGRLYFNIHSANFGGGEIRGQVVNDVNTLPLVTSIATSRTLQDTTFSVALEGVVTTIDFQLSSTTGSEYYIQDATGGLRVFIRGKVVAPIGTLLRVKNGFIYTINNRKNIEVRSNQVEALGTAPVPAPKLVTMTQYKANLATLEGQYIALSRVRLKRGSFPAAGSNSTLILTDASGDSLAMFIDLDTDIDGSTTPTGDFDVVGAGTQFNGVAQIQPSARADFKPAGSLPVELVEFRANAIGTDVELNWRTASETDNYGFEVQRKMNNTEFQKIGFVAGQGTTTQARSYKFIDSKLATGTYYYRLKQIDRDGSFSFSAVVEAVASIAPETFTLHQNHPNPFNPVTTIEFVLGTAQKARLAVYNVLGHEVALLFDGQVEAGKSYRFEFDGAKQASGVYFYRLQSGERTQIRKMLLSK